MTCTRRAMIKWSVAVVSAPSMLAAPRPRAFARQGSVAFSMSERVRLEPSPDAKEGTLPGGLADLTDAGEIAGWQTASAERTDPLIWTADGRQTPLEAGRFGGIINALSATGYAAGVTDLSPGGKTVDANGSSRSHTMPRVWQDGTPIKLVFPAEIGSVSGEAVDVNDDGVAVGTVTTNAEADRPRPIVWTADGIGSLLDAPADGYAWPWVISNDSTIVGSANQRLAAGDAESVVNVPALWSNGASDNPSLELLPFPDTEPGPGDFPGVMVALTFLGILDDGSAVAGYSSHLSQSVYRYDGGVPTRLNDGTDVVAYAMNGRGMLVGARLERDSGDPTLVVWENGSFRDLDDELPDLGDLDLRSVVAINARNQILATAIDPTGTLVGLVFSPLA